MQQDIRTAGFRWASRHSMAARRSLREQRFAIRTGSVSTCLSIDFLKRNLNLNSNFVFTAPVYTSPHRLSLPYAVNCPLPQAAIVDAEEEIARI